MNLFSEKAIREAADDLGVDFDDLVKAASKYFESDESPSQVELTKAEVNELVTEEMLFSEIAKAERKISNG
jgi:hypothetical protein